VTIFIFRSRAYDYMLFTMFYPEQWQGVGGSCTWMHCCFLPQIISLKISVSFFPAQSSDFQRCPLIEVHDRLYLYQRPQPGQAAGVQDSFDSLLNQYSEEVFSQHLLMGALWEPENVDESLRNFSVGRYWDCKDSPALLSAHRRTLTVSMSSPNPHG
jgi:hypothetical protein